MQRSFDFRIPEPAVPGRGPGRAAAAPPGGRARANGGLRDAPGPNPPERPDR